MYVSHLNLTDFRSYREVDLQLERGVTALVGPNGQGKTNLVEAIGYVANLSSHRVPSDTALIRAGAERAVVRSQIVRGDRPTLIEVEITPGKANRARINRSPVPRVRDIVGTLRTVLFAPEDLALVKGDPDGRRRFLDDLLVLLQPRLAGVRSDYDRVLKQRSALLKSANSSRRGSGSGADLRTLDVWDGHLASSGAELLAARIRLVHALRPHLHQAYEQVSSAQGDAAATYTSSLPALEARLQEFYGTAADPSVPASRAPQLLHAPTPQADPPIEDLPGPELLEAQLLEAMSHLRPKEIERGVCLVGPHRDDLSLTLGGLPAKGYASHGESWSLALALRIASYRLLSDDAGTGWGNDGEPVLILDDVFAELDVRRREKLSQLIASAAQVIITAAVAGDVPEELEGARVDVMAGEVTRVL